MEVGGDAPGEEADVVGGDLLGATGHADVAHNALDEEFARLLEAPGAGQGDPLFDIDPLGTATGAAAAVATAGRLGEDAVKLRVQIPGVLDVGEAIVVVGGVGEDQKHHLHPFLHQRLAPQFDVDPGLILAPHQYAAGAAHPLQATDPLYPRIARMPQRLNHRERWRGLNCLAVDHGVYHLLGLVTHHKYRHLGPR